ncbi:MAG TPA: hypothetical protein PLX50_00370 [Candidatus Aminicenantes bacterium]|nr:hypothetical protein [Candidatus Aminicenantes bacterium]
MESHRDKALYVLSFMIVFLSIAVAAPGVFYTTGGAPFEVANQYGDIVKMCGDGIYARDSYFRAPIFRGSDFVILFMAVPLLIVASMMDMKKKTLRQRLLLTSVIAVFTYYSASVAFGVTYNALHLLYIALFSASFFGLVVAMTSLDYKKVEKSVAPALPYKGIYVFLALTGTVLFAAWLPDIISALLANRSLAMIEVYTTEITYVLDMGIIGPAAAICLCLLKKRNGMGYVLLSMLLTICLVIGVMLPVQSLFQLSAGISLPLPVLITKAGGFVALALFALYLDIRFMKSVQD